MQVGDERVAAGVEGAPAEADRWSATAGELLTEKADLFPGSVPTLVTAACAVITI